MKKSLLGVLLGLGLCFSGCSYDNSEIFKNPGDKLGGGGTASVPSEVFTSELEQEITLSIDNEDLTTLKNNISSSNAVLLNDYNITSAGEYVLTGNITSNIVISVENNETTHLFLNGVNINVEGIAISNTNKKSNLIITVVENTTNTITNSGEDVNAIHVKGNLTVNGSGILSVTSSSKNAIKVSKGLKMVDSTINLTSSNHGVSARTIIASDSSINVLNAVKDGLNAECDDEVTSYTNDEGYIYLNNVNYSYTGSGDGLQADTFIVIDSGTYNIETSATFVSKTASNMEEYGLVNDDFKYIKSGTVYKRVASDYMGNSTLYAMTQSNKGIKVGEIEYEDSEGNDVSVTNGDYSLIINGGSFNIDSKDDALHVNYGNIFINGGTFAINTLDDGVTADALLKITGGTVIVNSCYEGLEGAQIEITGDTTKIDIVSQDDGINAASDISNNLHIIVSGGEVYVNASGDGIDSNGSVLISGGIVYIDGPSSNADASLDSESGILVNGGYLFAVGGLGMVETPASNSSQYIVSFAQSSSIASGTNLILADENDNSLFSFQTGKSSQSVIISCPELENGKTYKIYGGSTLLATFTINSKITTIGTTSSSKNPGGFVPGNNGGGPRR